MFRDSRSLDELSGLMGVPRIVTQVTGNVDKLIQIAHAESVIADQVTIYDRAGHATKPEQLPAALDRFVGRSELRRKLGSVLRAGMRRKTGPPTILAISGMPGVGKSALAMRLAHSTRALFPDGQL